MADPTVTLEVPLELLRTEKMTIRSPIAEGTYDSVGTNGLFEADPQILKFAGFALKKVNTKRVLIRNTSGMPRRIYVLPATTKAFTFVCNKKGNIAPGMSEEVFIHFTPEDYKYHYDCLRIQAEGNNFIIPIHAYPIMTKKARVVPTFIDLGMKELGSTIVKTICLESEVPVDFEYELVILKQHTDIKIEPVKGDVKGESQTEIKITFTPQTSSTAVSEFELHLSEFDFQPQVCRISGSGLPRYSSPSATLADPAKTLDKTNMKAKSGKTLLSLKASAKTSFRLRASNIKTTKQAVGEMVIDKMPKEAEYQTKALAQGLNPDTLIFEESFVKTFHAISTQFKEREIKFFQCIGDPALTLEEAEGIKAYRNDNAKYHQEFLKDGDLQRYSLVASDDRVILPLDLKIETECKWNVLGNDLFSLRKRILGSLVQMATVVLVRTRVTKRLAKLRHRFEEENVRSKEDAEKLVHEDWKESKKVVIGGDAGKGWKFEMDFSRCELEGIKLPVEYDMGVSSFKETMEPTEINGFDDLVEYPAIELLDYELNKYEPLNAPAYFNYFSLEDKKPLRPGAECEYSVRGVRGDPQLADKAPELRFAVIPATMLAPLNYNNERLVIPNALLRVYTGPEKYSETDVENALKPGVREGVNARDEISLNHKFVDQNRTLLGAYLPGNVGTRIARCFLARVSDFFAPPLSINDCCMMKATARDLPEKVIENDARLDQFTESGSDNQNEFELEVPAVDKLLKEFEQGDEAMKRVREKTSEFTTQYEEELTKLNNNISVQRVAVGARLDTAVEQLNANITKPQNKLYF